MSASNYIQVSTLCKHYKVEMTFFQDLNEHGLIEFVSVEEEMCIPEEKIVVLEKVIRMNQDLEINFAGIDTVLNLLEKIEELQNELQATKRRLDFYEGE